VIRSFDEIAVQRATHRHVTDEKLTTDLRLLSAKRNWWVKRENNSVIFNYCVIHRQALASKKPNPILYETLTEAVKQLILSKVIH
jgi:hypothetical protein